MPSTAEERPPRYGPTSRHFMFLRREGSGAVAARIEEARKSRRKQHARFMGPHVYHEVTPASRRPDGRRPGALGRYPEPAPEPEPAGWGDEKPGSGAGAG